MDYKKTLNITLSDKDPGAMPQRANLPTREPEILRRWEEMDLYRLSVEKEAPLGTFVLHDGPPYSNGDIHLGHAVNKIAKDIVVKFRTMQGYRAPYVPGWDNHGMPIENEVSKEFRRKHEKPDKVTMRGRCREYAAGWVERQREQFKRLGVRGDWTNPYLTMSRDFEAKIVDVFGELAEKGYVYRGLKPVLWCAYCETALADAEVEYHDHTSNSITVRFPVRRDPNRLFGGPENDPPDAYVLIWTTTPWTIPANVAVAAHPDAEYLVLSVDGCRYLVAEPLAPAVLRAIAPGEPTHEVWRGRGEALEGLVARHPLVDRDSPVVFATYVTMEDGTGLVHTAPGHGKEDFETGQQYGLDVLCPVDPSGTFTPQAGERFAGAHILGGEADSRVLEALKEAGSLLHHGTIVHSYPHCWRCRNPLLFRATVQWFMSIDHDGHRERSLQAIEQVQWFPPVSKNRIASMVANRPDWCLSRQRAWGVGIPAFYCRSCGKEVLSREAISAVRDMVAREGSDAWFARPASEVLPPGFACPGCKGTEFDKETDILDVWFDSGSTHRAVLESPRWPLLRWPADVYLEGSDQHRGWFNSSLMIAVGTKGSAPYRQVITNGWTLDETGKAMHKSLGNAVSPLDVMQKHGADILRLWVASTNYLEDVKCSDDILQTVAGVTTVNGKTQGTGGYWRIRNTFRFLVNNLYDFDPATDAVADGDMEEIDLWALGQLDRVVAECIAAYDTYEFHRVYHTINGFCAVELSAFYLDVLKDRLYCSAATSRERRSAQTALHRLAETLARVLAPILSYTAEEVWDHLRMPDKPQSVQLASFPAPEPARYADVLARWEPLMALREEANLAIERERQLGNVGKPLEARVDLVAEQERFAALQPYAAVLPTVLKVSQVSLTAGEPEGGLGILVGPAAGVKCARCWLVKEDVGADERWADLCGRCAGVVADIE